MAEHKRRETAGPGFEGWLVIIAIACGVNSIAAFMMWRDGFASWIWWVALASPAMIVAAILAISLVIKVLKWAQRQGVMPDETQESVIRRIREEMGWNKPKQR